MFLQCSCHASCHDCSDCHMSCHVSCHDIVMFLAMFLPCSHCFLPCAVLLHFSCRVLAMPLPCSCPCLCHAYILWDRRVPCLWPCLLCSCFRLLLLVVAIRPLSSSMQWLRRLVRCPWLSPSSAAPAPRRKKPAAMGRSVSQRRSVLRRPAGVIENASKVDWAWVDAQQEALRECVPGRRRGLVVTTHYSGKGVAEMAVQRVTPGHVRFHGACVTLFVGKCC